MPAPASVPNSFVAATPIVAAQANANFAALVTWVNSNTVATDGTVPFTGVPSGPATDPTTANQFTRKAYVDALIPVGMIAPYAGAAAPAKWLLCDGSAVSRATYAELFAVTNVLYGAGNGTTTFNVPDLRGRVPFGRDAAVTALDTLGETGGARDAVVVSHSHTASSGFVSNDHVHAFSGTTSTDGSHQHTPLDGAQAFSTVGGATTTVEPMIDGDKNGWFYTVGASNSVFTNTSANGSHSHTISGNTGGISANHTHTITVNAQGVSATNANLPPYQVFNYIIRTNV